MTFRRRYQRSLLLLTATVLAVVISSGCKPGPTTIVVSVSFLNPSENPRMFPPDDVLPWDFTDDVWYVRLVDNNGTGAVIWESEAYPASNLASFTYGNILYPGETNVTLDSGYYLDSLVFTLTDAQVNTAVMDLSLEAYLFESPIIPPLNPADPLRYSTITGDIEWQTTFPIQTGDVKIFQLTTRAPFQ